MDTLEERDDVNIKFTKKFRNWLDDSVLQSTFAIKTKSQLATLCTIWWVKKYQKANPSEKEEMINDMKKLRADCENDGILHNSREIQEDDEN